MSAVDNTNIHPNRALSIATSDNGTLSKTATVRILPTFQEL